MFRWEDVLAAPKTSLVKELPHWPRDAGEREPGFLIMRFLWNWERITDCAPLHNSLGSHCDCHMCYQSKHNKPKSPKIRPNQIVGHCSTPSIPGTVPAQQFRALFQPIYSGHCCSPAVPGTVAAQLFRALLQPSYSGHCCSPMT